jgi:nitrous oxidase accessory protein NosD
MKIPAMFLGFACVAALGPARADLRSVDCGKGDTITEALIKADPGDTIRVTGTCRERITIATDRQTLDGQGGAILDGGGGAPSELTGLVTIDGARGVKVTGFTIQNSFGDGILPFTPRRLKSRTAPCRTMPSWG